jgi:pyridoxine 5'-phosphate synthase PdxJ
VQLAATVIVHALFVGWKELVSEMKRLMAEAAICSMLKQS